YRCPFARNAHEHLITALRHGADDDWHVRYVPFSLGQVHVAEGEPDIWERPAEDSGLLALQAGVVVRDRWPELFPDVHLALFALRHDEGRRFEEGEVRRVLTDHGVDTDAVFADIESGAALARVRDEHEAAAEEHEVWGVPTFILGDAAVFVRLMDRPQGDGEHARRSIQRILDLLVDAPELNEFKHTSLKR
ncbi:MAG TPA: DsbA family protein, partial [Acidimicrobiales bacterium]